MGTRSEIWIKRVDREDWIVKLYKHWDGYPEYMMPYFKEFAEFASKAVGGQLHWLSYPEDVGALLIAFDYEDAKKLYSDGTIFYIRPDIRPKGYINDLIEYVYVIRISKSVDQKVIWTIKCYRVKSVKEANAIRGEDLELEREASVAFSLEENRVVYVIRGFD